MTTQGLGFFPVRSICARAVAVLAISLFIERASILSAQPTIGHKDVHCVSRDQFTQFLADIEPPDDIRSAKIYFRSALYPEFYYVQMTLEPASETFHAVLPLPNRETTRIVYYLEAVDVSFQTSRSRDFEVTVSNECHPGPGGLLFPGEDPGIIVGSLTAAAPALPAGFQATGIAGFLSAAGAVTGAGGGIGLPIVIGATAAAATGVGVVVATGGNDGGSPGGSGAAPTPTGSPTSGGSGSSTTTSTGSGSTPGNPPPSGTTTTTTTTVPGGPSTPSPTTSTVPPALTACFAWQALGSCKVKFDSCSTPASDISRYEWRMLGSPVPDPPPDPSFTFSFDADPRCLGSQEFNRPVRLTVYDYEGRSASIQQNVLVRPGTSYRQERSPGTRLSFESQLVALPSDGSVRGQVLVDHSPLPPLDNASPSRYEVAVGVGANEVLIEALLVTPAPAQSLWEMDFSSTEAVVPGSFRPERGTVVSATGRRIVFRLNGGAGEVLRFRVELR